MTTRISLVSFPAVTRTRGAWALASAALLSLASVAAPARAADLVFRLSSDKPVGGEVIKVTRTEVVVKQQIGMKEESVPANDIDYVKWESEPAPLNLARGSEKTGSFEQAVKHYDEAIQAAPNANDALKRDLELGRALAATKHAMRSGAELPAAIESLRTAINASRDHYRFYAAQLVLGRALLAAKDSEADAVFQSVAGAPWVDVQLAGKLGIAQSAFDRGDIPAAQKVFEEVAAVEPQTAPERSRRLEAKLGKAKCLQSQKDDEAAVQVLDSIIDEAAPTDARLQAEAYLRQGDSLQTLGRSPTEALLAYLRVQLIPEFAAEKDLLAEALYKLSQLWPKANEPERAAEAADQLRREFPDSPWAKMLPEGAGA